MCCLRYSQSTAAPNELLLQCAGMTMADIPKDTLEDACQLVKANSIEVCLFSLFSVPFSSFRFRGPRHAGECQPLGRGHLHGGWMCIRSCVSASALARGCRCLWKDGIGLRWAAGMRANGQDRLGQVQPLLLAAQRSFQAVLAGIY